ncbi:MFS transporter [Actinophytocola sp.]|uniref:MFS transporter n=1 Tax=Actinophytocola sp. TaxID=1872138 RepID=UPI002D7F0E39|nr:MFS transporter [Actinophytocola sp.]HET9141828.1 MFS transporter [Actinophytocola sp.]
MRAPISDWNPEDIHYWEHTGRRIARRNLVFSIFAEHLGFSVWLIWSVVAVNLPKAGFPFSADQLFWLVAVPNLVGAFLRLPYTAAVARFGGRDWTVFSAAVLVIPLLLLAYCVTTPGTPYWMFLVAAATAGFGGGNFASSMANISYFYPERHKGSALGVNAAGGNIGVAVVQVAVPVVIGVALLGDPQAPGLYLQNAALLYLVPVVLAAICAALLMDDLPAVRARMATQLTALRSKHTWVISVLYIGTFGSFIGYSAAFPLLISLQFTGSGASPAIAFLGPLVGSLSRPAGGWLSDRLGGARVTAAVFLLMGLGVTGVLASLGTGSFALFLAAFLFLFVVSGVGNGSTYRMIPAIFRAEATRTSAGPPSEPALALARTRAAAVIGLASAVGAFGGFLIPRGLGMSISRTGSITTALLVFLAGYGMCLVLTWWFYLRTVLVSRSPSLAAAGV